MDATAWHERAHVRQIAAQTMFAVVAPDNPVSAVAHSSQMIAQSAQYDALSAESLRIKSTAVAHVLAHSLSFDTCSCESVSP